MQIKAEYLSTTSGAAALLKAIDDNIDFEWARNHQNRGVLAEKLKLTQDSVGDMQTILLSGASELRRDMGGDALLLLASRFCDVMAPIVADLGSHRDLLLKRHKA